MATIALVASGDDTVFVNKSDGKLYRRDLTGFTPAGKAKFQDSVVEMFGEEEDWLNIAVGKHGMYPVVGRDGKGKPDIGDEFPDMRTERRDGGTVYVSVGPLEIIIGG